MKSFKDYAAERDVQESMLGSIGYKLQQWGASPKEKAKAVAIDAFGKTYQAQGPKLKQQADTMNQLEVPASDELKKKVAGVGKKFDKVVGKSRMAGTPVRQWPPLA